MIVQHSVYDASAEGHSRITLLSEVYVACWQFGRTVKRLAYRIAKIIRDWEDLNNSKFEMLCRQIFLGCENIDVRIVAVVCEEAGLKRLEWSSGTFGRMSVIGVDCLMMKLHSKSEFTMEDVEPLFQRGCPHVSFILPTDKCGKINRRLRKQLREMYK